MKGKIARRCPACGREMHVLRCANCGTEVRGDFILGRFAQLSEDQLLFLEMLIRRRGRAF